MTLIKFILSIAFIFSLSSAFAQSYFNHGTKCKKKQPDSNICMVFRTCRAPAKDEVGLVRCRCVATQNQGNLKGLLYDTISREKRASFYFFTARSLDYTKEDSKALCTHKLNRIIEKYRLHGPLAHPDDFEMANPSEVGEPSPPSPYPILTIEELDNLYIGHRCSVPTICYRWRDINNNQTEDTGEIITN